MKQITKMSRLTGELEKAFRLINEELFNNELPTPIITVIPTPKAYAHYVPFDIWSTKESAKREINIASGTLDRPIENIIASLVHEMVHMYNDVVLNINDCSNKGTYHNKQFKNEYQRTAKLHRFKEAQNCNLFKQGQRQSVIACSSGITIHGNSFCTSKQPEHACIKRKLRTNDFQQCLFYRR